MEKIYRYIKIFSINVFLVVVIGKIVPIITHISERSFERILLLYFLVFNLILLFLIIKEEKRKKEG